MRRGQSKSITALLITLLLVLQMAGCGKEPEFSVDSQEGESESVQETISEDAQTDIQDEEETSVTEDMQTDAPEETDVVMWGEFGFGMQEQIMRLKTGIYDRSLTPEDLLTVIELEIDDTYLLEVDWISYLKNLTILKLPKPSISGKGIDNLDFLSGLTHLKELDLSGEYGFRDINGLEGLRELYLAQLFWCLVSRR